MRPAIELCCVSCELVRSIAAGISFRGSVPGRHPAAEPSFAGGAGFAKYLSSVRESLCCSAHHAPISPLSNPRLERSSS